jgi:hypothetical protein
MKKIKIDQLKSTVKKIRKSEPSDGPINRENTKDALPPLPEFRMSPGMQNGRGEVINPETINE